MVRHINESGLSRRSEYIGPSITQIRGVLLASPRSPRAEAAPLKGSLVSVRVRPGAHRTIRATHFPAACQIVSVVQRDNVPIEFQPRWSLCDQWAYPSLACALNPEARNCYRRPARHSLCLFPRRCTCISAIPPDGGIARHRPVAAGRAALFQPLMLGPTRERVTRMMTRRSRAIAAR